MRIPFPERIPYRGALLFAVVLMVMQLLEHTAPIFAFCSFGFVLVATAAFNAAGGMYRPAGTYVFFNATLAVGLGLVVKAALGEPGEKNLTDGVHTMELYLLGMVSILAAVYVDSRFRPREPLLTRYFPTPDLRSTYIGAAVIGVSLTLFFVFKTDVAGGTVLSLLRNTNQYLPFAIIVGTMYTVRATKGKRSMTPVLAALILLATIGGLLSFSKQGMFTPVFSWLIGAAIARYQLKIVNVILLGLTMYAAATYGTAYSQVGRELQTTTFLGNVKVGIGLLTHPKQMNEQYAETSQADYGQLSYFDEPMGLFDRLQMISIDDALNSVTEKRGTFGYEPVIEGAENLIPHFLWPNKPVPYFGNAYMHQIGGIDEADVTTGVSFSITADAYHEGGIAGVLFVEPLVLALVFLSFSWLLGDLRGNPAVIIVILATAHVAPEGALYGVFFLDFVALVALMFAFTASYILPVVASVIEPERLSTALLEPPRAT